MAKITYREALNQALSEEIEREVEIKAVTSHELQFSELQVNEMAISQWEDVPDFQGPGWFCDVVFDI